MYTKVWRRGSSLCLFFEACYIYTKYFSREVGFYLMPEPPKCLKITYFQILKKSINNKMFMSFWRINIFGPKKAVFLPRLKRVNGYLLTYSYFSLFIFLGWRLFHTKSRNSWFCFEPFPREDSDKQNYSHFIFILSNCIVILSPTICSLIDKTRYIFDI